jgi:hypothetical protein
VHGRYGFVYGDQKCNFCEQPCVGQEFYLFPCGHAFHTTCLYNAVLPHLPSGVQQQVGELRQEAQGGEGAGAEAQEKFDDIVAAECFLCGDMMVQCVDQRLDLDPLRERGEWAL